ncbi:YjgN family protein [Ramlibacter sp. H39-3-26]|uniref:YjgN family protein n=1 Tax=Curvibacter soli TaxID=3031331 RepID=UPI0023DBFFE6|nr:YjgN family protein [Ramlibacter sp. H39-3-26]MDF1483895.1 YjgN family protein [Ramlibacter sp. H39-3-26]
MGRQGGGPLLEGIQQMPLRFTGSGGGYFRVWIVNVLLGIVTLGFYTPWARRRTAQYFYSHTEVAGSPLEFTGQQRRMVFGFLLLVALYAIFKIAANTGQDLAVSLFMVGGAALAPYFWASAMRFRLSATRWRGLRLQLRTRWGEVYRASWPVFAAALLWVVWVVAFGMLTPESPQGRPLVRQTPGAVWALLALVVALSVLCLIRLEYNYKSLFFLRASIGSEHGRWKPAYGDFVRVWLATLAVFVLGVLAVGAIVAALAGGSGLLMHRTRPPGLVFFVFIVLAILGFFLALVLASAPARAYRDARMFQLVWNNVGVSHIVRFKTRLRTGAYVALRLKNIVLTLLTLGFYRPFARVSEYRMKVESVTLYAKGDLGRIAGRLARQQAGGLGDALADAVGLDIIG